MYIDKRFNALLVTGMSRVEKEERMEFHAYHYILVCVRICTKQILCRESRIMCTFAEHSFGYTTRVCCSICSVEKMKERHGPPLMLLCIIIYTIEFPLDWFLFAETENLDFSSDYAIFSYLVSRT